jgi:perosamine synthetase
MGTAQTRKIEAIVAAKRLMAATYNECLADLDWLQRPAELPWARNVYWMYGIVLREESGVDRDYVVGALRRAGIETRTFFCPMNQQPALQRLPGFRSTACPVADGLWRRGLYLPSSASLTAAQISSIAAALRACGPGNQRASHA